MVGSLCVAFDLLSIILPDSVVQRVGIISHVVRTLTNPVRDGRTVLLISINLARRCSRTSTTFVCCRAASRFPSGVCLVRKRSPDSEQWDGFLMMLLRIPLARRSVAKWDGNANFLCCTRR